MRGPIDYIVVGFEKPNFTGEILAELEKATANNTINVLAFALVSKNSEGTVTTVDFANLGDEALLSFAQALPSNNAVTQDDIDEVGELLENDMAAGVLVVEHVWARGLKQAIINANGSLIAEGRIHPEAAGELEA